MTARTPLAAFRERGAGTAVAAHARGLVSTLASVWALVLILPLGAVLMAALIAFLPEYAADRLSLQQAVRHSEPWRRQVLSIIEHGSDIFDGAELDATDRVELAKLTRASDIFRMKFFERDGRILWSTRAGEIGTVTDKPHFFETVAAGGVYAKLARTPASEVDNLWLHALDGNSAQGTRVVAEIYRPVTIDGVFVGAVEFYTDLTDNYLPLVGLIRMLIIGLSTAGLVVTTSALIYLLRRNARRMREMRARAERDSEIMAQQVRLAREVQLLGELNEWLQSAATLNELFDMVARYMGHILPVSEGAIYVYSNSRDVLEGGVAWNGARLHDHIRPDSCWALRRGRTFVYGAGEVTFACEHTEPHDGRPYFCFPILAHGETVGLMHLRAAAEESPQEFRDSRKLAQICAEQISMAIANVQMRDQLREQSIRDSLTGLFNRRHMLDRLRALTERSRKKGGAVALLSIDVDHFKKFNDNHGHDAGDMVLRAVATVMEQSVSGEEIACRPGGEEFAVVLPGVAGEAAAARAEALRAAVEDIELRYGDRVLPHVSISVGVAEFPRDAALVQELILTADRALYAAKAHGRNCVVPAGAVGGKPEGAAATGTRVAALRPGGAAALPPAG